jgi:hypothetical protein
LRSLPRRTARRRCCCGEAAGCSACTRCASSHASAIPLAIDLTGAALASGPQLTGFLQDAEVRYRLPPPRALALYRIAQYLAHAGIVETSSIAATARLRRSRRSAAHSRVAAIRAAGWFCSTRPPAPLHRAETEMELWGTERDLVFRLPDR